MYTSKDGTGYLTTSSRIWELFLGASIFSLQDSLNKKVFNNDLVKRICSIFGFCLVLLAFAVIDLSYGSWYISTSILTVLGTILVILAAFNCSLFNNGFIKFVSSSTLSIYLWHYPLMIFMIKMNIVDSSLFLLYAVLIVSVFSVLSYKFIESLSFNTYKIAKTSTLIVCFLVCLFGYLNFKADDCSTYLSKFIRDDSFEITSNYTNSSLIDLGNNLSVTTVATKENKIPSTFFIGDSHTGQLLDFFLNSKEPLAYYTAAATMAYGKYFSSMENILYPKLRDRMNKFYETYKAVLAKLQDNSRVVITNHFLAYYGEFLKENNLKRNSNSLNLYVDAIIKDFDEQISLYPKLHFYICTDGISIPISMAEQSKVNLIDSFLQGIIKTGISKSIDVAAYENEVILAKFNEYAKSKGNVFIINRLKTFQDKNSLKEYRIILNNINLFKDGNHQSPYGAQILGKYIIDSVNANEQSF